MTRILDLIVEKLELRVVGIGQDNVVPTILIEIEKCKGPSIGKTVQARHSGDIFKLPSAMIEKDTIAFVSAKGMTPDHRLAIHLLARIEHARHAGILAGIHSFFRKSFIEVCIRAHDRAPKATSQIHLRGRPNRWRVKPVGDIEIKEAVVVEI